MVILRQVGEKIAQSFRLRGGIEERLSSRIGGQFFTVFWGGGLRGDGGNGRLGVRARQGGGVPAARLNKMIDENSKPS
jgi:hypothetical protein